MPGAAHDLRQLAAVAERVRAPELACSGGRTRARRSAARAGTGARATRRTGCCSRARPSCRRPERTGPSSTFARMRCVQVGVALLDPCVLLRLRAGEAVLRVLVHVARRRSRTCAPPCGRSRRAARATPCRCARGRSRAISCACVRVAVLVERARGSRGSPRRCRSARARAQARRPSAGSIVGRRPRARAASRSRGRAARPRRRRRASSQRVELRPARPACRTCRCTPARPAARRSPPARASRQRVGRSPLPCVFSPWTTRPSLPERRLAARVPEQLDARARATRPAPSRGRGTSTSPRAARSARRARRGGSRAAAPRPRDAVDRPGDEQLVDRRTSRDRRARAAAPTSARAGARVYSRWRIKLRGGGARRSAGSRRSRARRSRAATDRPRARTVPPTRAFVRGSTRAANSARSALGEQLAVVVLVVRRARPRRRPARRRARRRRRRRSRAPRAPRPAPRSAAGRAVGERGVLERLGPDADDHAAVAAERGRRSRSSGIVDAAERDGVAARAAPSTRFIEGEPMNAATNMFAGLLVERAAARRPAAASRRASPRRAGRASSPRPGRA